MKSVYFSTRLAPPTGFSVPSYPISDGSTLSLMVASLPQPKNQAQNSQYAGNPPQTADSLDNNLLSLSEPNFSA